MILKPETPEYCVLVQIEFFISTTLSSAAFIAETLALWSEFLFGRRLYGDNSCLYVSVWVYL